MAEIELGRKVHIIAEIRTKDGYEFQEDSGTVVEIYNGGNQFVLADRQVKAEITTGRLSGEPIALIRYEDRNPRKYERLSLVELS